MNIEEKLKDNILSVILVTKNDSEIIEDRIVKINKEIKKMKVDYEIVVIDNNSNDTSIEIVRKISKKIPYIRTIVLSKSYLIEVALTAGLDSCIGDYVIVFNILTDPPKIINRIVKMLLEGNDIVLGKFKKEIFNKSEERQLLLKLMSKISSHEFRENNNFLTGLNRRAVNAITRTRRKSRQLEYLNSLIGLREITITYRPLLSFKKKIRNESLFQTLIRIIDISISNSFKPLRIISLMGLFGSLLFIFYIIFVVFLSLILNMEIAPKGWISLGTVVSTLFFLLFSMLSIISEYIIRVLAEVRNEPIYFVSAEYDKSVINQKTNKLNIHQ